MFERVLVANRGEIAIRIMRTLRDLGISPVTIHSEADVHALHVRYADASVNVGPEASTESYLRMDRVIEAALSLGAQAIHPGYGFLSENAEFARQVEAAGLVWIGPPPHSITTMGDKLLARQTVLAAEVPVVPGVSEAVADGETALKIAREVGFPVMVKASAGGGGKGMRMVTDEAQLVRAFDAAKREAANAFGNDAVYVEKFIVEPHHVEIQVLCDTHGNALYIGERECSVQRRHQKVVEECPSPFIDEPLRQRMGAVAVAAAKACGYVGAGTVEFLVGGDGGFYFLEMNTRLQVEHPVTELVYGVDLVELQLRVAAGEALTLKQADLVPRGHALECRIYAEDPDSFLPSPGTITALRWPEGPGVRVDAGVDNTSVVPMVYDPMIAKLCTWGSDRGQAMRRMSRALNETAILGITTNIALHHRVLAHPGFAAGRYDTSLLNTPLEGGPKADADWTEATLAATAIARFEADVAKASAAISDTSLTGWRVEGHERMLRGG